MQQSSHYISSTDRAHLVALLFEAKLAIDNALNQAAGDEMFKDQKNRCLASIEQARAKLAYAWNTLSPFVEE